MKVNRILCVILALILVCSLFAGCGNSGNQAGQSQNSKGALPVVRFAAVPGLPGMPAMYLAESGIDEKYGFTAEVTYYASGIPMNEALAAGLWDVGPIGAAAVTSLAQYDAKLIADITSGLPGVSIIVPKDSPIANVTGASKEYPDIRGDAGSVRGARFLTVKGAMMNYLALLYLQSIGLTENDVELIHMEQSQLGTAFSSGEAEIASMGPPATTFNLLKSGEAVELANFKMLGNPQQEVLLASNDFYTKNSELLVKVVAAYFEANDKLSSDVELQKEYLKKWYKDNGQDVIDEAIAREVGDGSVIISSERAKADIDKLGSFLYGVAEFNAKSGSLEKEKLDVIKNNIKNDILKKALELLAQKK